MKRYFKTVAILSLVFVAMVSCAKTRPVSLTEEDILSPEAGIVNQLGRSLTEIFTNPTKVICYEVEWQDSLSKTDQLVEGKYVRGKEVCKLSKEEIVLLQYLILNNPSCYSDNNPRVMSPYEPAYEFVIKRKKEEAQIVISISDSSWTVIYDGKSQFNHNLSTDQLVAKFIWYFQTLINRNNETNL